MIFEETRLKDAIVIQIQKIEDSRGFFARTWCRNEFRDHGLNPDLAQCNISYNYKRGTLRGMHFQAEPNTEVKLVRCIHGTIYDVVIDLRANSPTYLKWFGVELSEINRTMLYIPEGFAHGFQTLSNGAEVFYQMSGFYVPGAERGVRWNDPAFEIDWPITKDLIISEADQSWPAYEP